MLESEGQGAAQARLGAPPRPHLHPAARSPSSSGFRQALLRFTDVHTFSMLLQRLRPLMAPWEHSGAAPSQPGSPGPATCSRKRWLQTHRWHAFTRVC